MELLIDIGDWENEAREEEIEMRTKDQAIEARRENQLHPAKAARLYIVARELGLDQVGLENIVEDIIVREWTRRSYSKS